LLLSVSMQVMGDTLFSERGIGVIFPRSPRPFLGASLAATARMGHARRGRCRMWSRLLYKKRPRGGQKPDPVRLPQGGHQGLFDPSMPPRLVPKSGTGTQKINDTSPTAMQSDLSGITCHARVYLSCRDDISGHRYLLQYPALHLDNSF
jgi:hypothetical protein